MISVKKTEKIKVLVVDDAPFIREIVRHICDQDEKLDWIGEAQDGVEAVEKTDQLRPDVILMDMVMPKQNGLESTKVILERFPSTKVIAFSTLDQEYMMLKAIEAGCCNFVHKPFEAEQLREVIYKSVMGRS